MIEYEKNIIMSPDNKHYDYSEAIEKIIEVCENMDLKFEGIPMTGNDFGFGHAEKILFWKKDGTDWTQEEMTTLDIKINERLY
jgi:hypothetical protein